MSWFEALILGVIEGITEFLPISSTGHLILASTLLGIPTTEFLKSFEIAIQLGAIAAVVVLYWKSFLSLPILTKIAAGFVPTAIIGFTVYEFAKQYLLGNPVVVVWALFLGGIALIVFELLHKERSGSDEQHSIETISLKQAVGVGLFQSIAIVPGVSRSAASIVGGLLLGVPRVAIVQFSFLLAVPTMAMATTYDIYKNAALFSSEQFGLLFIGFIAAFAVALLSMKALLRFVRSHTFIPFGIYRIVIAALFFVFIIL